MALRSRRKFLLGVGAVTLSGGTSVLSGASGVRSTGRSGGPGWVRLVEPDIVRGPEQPGGPDAGDSGSLTGETRIQVIRDPDGGGSNRGHGLRPRPRIVDSRSVQADDHGFVTALDLTTMNPRASTRVGRLDGERLPPAEQDAAFMIANVGGVGQPGVEGQSVDISLSLKDDDGTDVTTDAIGFPWALDVDTAGSNLVGTRVRMDPRDTIGVSIVVDAGRDDGALERISSLGVSVRRIPRPTT